MSTIRSILRRSGGQSGAQPNAVTFVTDASGTDLFAGATKVLDVDPAGNLNANVKPRTNTLANLTSIVNGKSEIAVATDVDALVVLKDSGAVSFGRVPASALVDLPNDADTGANTVIDFRATRLKAASLTSYSSVGLTIETVASPTGDSAALQLLGGDTNSEGGAGGEFRIEAGNGVNATESYGGELFFRAGHGVTGLGASYFGTKITPTTSVDSLVVSAIGVLPALGLFGKPPLVRRSIVGSRASGVAYANLLAWLDDIGLIINNTTA